ncbi:MAG: tRNA pseudouridine(55) synthase TruB [Acidobacteria bacterium]|nr:MAG: tRNA pseudouridine(55) synthase TruB [Acidobacteriota bacterium]
MDGLLIIDKPVGPTSHDVVARIRRLLGEPRIGHTGTLDPLASGVLPLVVGRATRLARFLSSADKVYEATLHLGIATDSGDRSGTPVGTPYVGPMPDAPTIDRALDAFRGRFLQRPPDLSAKKIGGKRSYKLTRARARVRDRAGPGSETALAETTLQTLAPVAVTTHAISVVSVSDCDVTLTVECSAGFYVRALAADLGERLGVGAHLSALRRTRSGDATLSTAIELAETDDRAAGYSRVLQALVPLDEMLPGLTAIRLTEHGIRKVRSGRDVMSSDVEGNVPPALMEREVDRKGEDWYRLMDGAGHLLALGRPVSGSSLLHPSLVLV